MYEAAIAAAKELSSYESKNQKEEDQINIGCESQEREIELVLSVLMKGEEVV